MSNVEPTEGFKRMLADAAFAMAHPDVRYTIKEGIDGNVSSVKRASLLPRSHAYTVERDACLNLKQ